MVKVKLKFHICKLSRNHFDCYFFFYEIEKYSKLIGCVNFECICDYLIIIIILSFFFFFHSFPISIFQYSNWVLVFLNTILKLILCLIFGVISIYSLNHTC